MKKTTILITALIMLFVGAPQAKAVPMYYTFAGTVTSAVDGAGIIGTQFPGLAFGDLVSYTVIIDFDVPATETHNDTSVHTYTNDANSDYFYADAYSGDYLLSIDGGSNNADGDVAEYNYGYDYAGAIGILYVNSADEKMMIFSSPVLFASMAVGASGLTGYTRAYSAVGPPSYIDFNLTLMSISATPPPASVPEPSTLLLLGSGLLGLGMFRRVRQEG